MSELIKQMLNAKTEPSEKCPKAENHEFRGIAHADGRESYTWFYKCNHCGEVVKKTYKRTGEDLALWNE